MASREVVVRLQLDDTQSVAKFQALRKEQAQLSLDLNATRKAIRDNDKAYQDLLNTKVNNSKEEEVLGAKIAANRVQFDALTKTLVDQELVLKSRKAELNGIATAEDRVRAAAVKAAAEESAVAKKAAADQEATRKYLQGVRLRSLDLETKAAAKADAEQVRLDKQSTAEQEKTRKYLLQLRYNSFKQEEQAAKQAAAAEKQALAGSFSSQLKSSLSSVAAQYIGIGAAIYGVQRILGGAIDTIVTFDKNLANVSALGGEYRANIDALGEAAKNIGPKFGVGASKALESIEALAKAGVSAADILGGGLEGALTLAAAGELNAGDAAEFAAASMVQFGLKGKDVAHIADLLSAAANKAQGEVSDFGNALKFVGPIAASMNVSIDEVVGTLATFAQNGILGEMAGTSLRGVLASLTSPAASATKEMKALGIVTADGASKLFDAQGKFLGLANLAGVLQEATKGLTDEQRANALGQIFGNKQITAANILIKEGTKGVQDFTAAVNDQGIAARVAADKLNSLSGNTDKLTAAWGKFVLSIEDGKGTFAGFVTEFIKGTTDILTFLTGDDTQKSVEDFTNRVQVEYAKLGHTDILSADKGDEIVNRYRLITDEVKKLGGSSIDLDLLIARGKTLAEELGKVGRTPIQEAALRATFTAVNEEIQKRTDALKSGARTEAEVSAFIASENEKQAKSILSFTAEVQRQYEKLGHTDILTAAKGDAIVDRLRSITDSAKAAGGSIEDVQKLISSGRHLAEALGQAGLTDVQQAALRAAFVQVNFEIQKRNDALRAGTEYQAASTVETAKATDATKEETVATDGSTKATKAKADAIVNATNSIADYNAQIAILKKEQEQSTSSEQFKTYQAQIDTLTEKVQFLTGELVKMPALKDVQFTATGTDAGKIPEPPEIHILPALLEKARIEELQHIVDYNLQRQILNEQYNEGVIKSKEELNAKLADIDKAQEAHQNEVDEAALSAAQSLATSIQGVIDEAFDFRINTLDEQQKSLQDRLASATDAQTKKQIQGEIDRTAAQKKSLQAQKTALQQFAVAAALMDTYASANAAYRSQLTIPSPDAPIRAAVAAAAAIIAGLLNVAKIEGFAEGGTVPEGRGTVTSSWGRPIRRSNGDDVLVTLKRKEKVLNSQQIARMESIAGRGIWARIGVPGHALHSGTPGFALGGTVSYLPSPSSSELGAERNIAELRAINFAPVVSVTEINRVQARVNVIENLGTA